MAETNGAAAPATTTTTTYDFIVVGAGPAGCVVSSRLAESSAKPSVLLVEAGADNNATASYRHSDHRYSLAFTEPSLGWGYVTTPQAGLKGRQVPYARGKGLGGGTLVNFSSWMSGAKGDYDHWADLVDDEAWRWERVKERMKKIERVHPIEEECQLNDMQRRVMEGSKDTAHSTSGKLDLSWAKVWSQHLEEPAFRAAEQMGWRLKKDGNSGDVIGASLPPSTFFNGERVTARDAYLHDKPDNLTIVTNESVGRILFSDKTAIGVQLASGMKYFTKKEVILSAGTANTPKLLMLSGIGPAEHLEEHGIQVLQNSPGIGSHLIDHPYVAMTHLLKADVTDSAFVRADPVYQNGGQVPAGFVKVESLPSSEEFRALDDATRGHLADQTVPHFEWVMISPLLNPGTHVPQPGDRFRSLVVFVMNAQSEGSVTLASSDPLASPVVDSNVFSHPYDRRVGIESLRTLMKMQTQEALRSTMERVVAAPADDSDEAIIDFWEKHGAVAYHMSGTVRMGKDERASVGNDFRVKGLEQLRVVDLSVAPTLPSGHAMAPAYLIGETAAEKMISEYDLA